VPTHLETELREQGAALAARADAGREAAAHAAELLARPGVDHLLIAARGSSDNAARYGQYLLGLDGGLAVGLAAPWLYGHGHRPPRLPGAAVLGISQSGRSRDIVAVLEAGRFQGRPTIAITNEPGSPLAQAADVVIPLGVGEERSVAATKTYVASLHALAQVGAAIRPSTVTSEVLDVVPEMVTELSAAQLEGRERFDRLGEASLLTAVGRGLDYATACEAGLKLRELGGTPAEAFSTPDLLHGPVAALGPGSALWIASGVAHTEDAELESFRQLTGRTGLHVAVSADPRVLDLAEIPVLLPVLPEWATPLLGVVPAQVAALRLAETRRVSVDHPHGLSKVTLTS
jgi:glucosamine--fructose-6-phosphate aminotransferase (isomerizing)